MLEELERAITSGTAEKRLKALWQVTDLFIAGAGDYGGEQVAVFGDVLLRLAADIEAKSRAKLASRLASIPNAPAQVIRHLAFDDDITVARPVLSRSPRLDDNDLAANAQTKSQAHLLAIAQRGSLSEAVTDVLVARGERHVVRSVARNVGARFSDAGLRMLVKRSVDDGVLQRHLGARKDIPHQHLVKLIEKASAEVRKKLTASNPQAASAVEKVVEEIVGKLHAEARKSSPAYASAEQRLAAMHQENRLGEAEIYQLARALKMEETVVAIGLLCGLPVEVVQRAMFDDGPDMVLILAKTIGLSWTTTKAVLLLRSADRGMSTQDLDDAMMRFTRLQPEIALSVTQFYRTRRHQAA